MCVNTACAAGGREFKFCLGRRPLLGDREISKASGCLPGLDRQNWKLKGPRIQWKENAEPDKQRVSFLKHLPNYATACGEAIKKINNK